MGGKLPAEKKEQAVANYVQRANIKKNAALAIKVMYKKILDILKKVCLNLEYSLISLIYNGKLERNVTYFRLKDPFRFIAVRT